MVVWLVAWDYLSTLPRHVLRVQTTHIPAHPRPELKEQTIDMEINVNNNQTW